MQHVFIVIAQHLEAATSCQALSQQHVVSVQVHLR